MKKYLLVYDDSTIMDKELDELMELVDIVHVSMISRNALIGKRYLDIFVSANSFPTQEQWIELKCCICK
jgi:hypothetical protein